MPAFVRYWTNSGQGAALVLVGSVANDPNRTLAGSAPLMNECRSEKKTASRQSLRNPIRCFDRLLQ